MRKLVYLTVAAFLALSFAACNDEIDKKLITAPKIENVKATPDVINHKMTAAKTGEEVVIRGEISSDYGPLYIFMHYMTCPAETADKLGSWFTDETQTSWSPAWSSYWSSATVNGPSSGDNNSPLVQMWNEYPVNNETFTLTLPGFEAGTVVMAYVYTNNGYTTFSNGYILYKVVADEMQEEEEDKPEILPAE